MLNFCQNICSEIEINASFLNYLTLIKFKEKPFVQDLVYSSFPANVHLQRFCS